MRGYDRWLTTPPEYPEPLDWEHDYLELSPTAFTRRNRPHRVAGHRCEDCNRFLPTTPDDSSASGESTVFEFRCACGSLASIEVEFDLGD